MITFKRIKFKNFLSTGNAFREIDLSMGGTTLITGENGAGKTTILDALTFVLYGKPYRNINKPQLVNSINKKNLLVEIEFVIGKKNYRVVRGIKPNIFEIYSDGELVNQTASAYDYQEYLTKNILRIDYKTFCQVVILGSTSFVPFMVLPAAQRRQIIEDLLDLEIFSKMNEILKNKISNNNDLIRECDYNLKLLKEKYELLKTHSEEIKKNIEEEIKKAKEKIKTLLEDKEDYEKRIKKYDNEISSLKEKINNYSSLKEKIDEIKILDSQLSRKLKSLKKDIEFYSSNETCPTCNQTIDEEFKNKNINKIKSEIDKINTNSVKLKNLKENIEKEIEKIEKINSQIIELTTNKNIDETAYKHIVSRIKEIINEIESKQENINDFDESNLEKIKEKIRIESDKKKELIGLKEKYDMIALMLKDSGIKSVIIKQYIPIINKLINSYLAKMDFFVHFELNETFEEKIKSRHRDNFSYNSFSEGEKTRINLAILFTWRQIARMRNSASTNLLIFDEVLDGSTDQNGIEAFFNIINEFGQSGTVMVISHTQDMHESKFDHVIKFKKVKGFSTMEIQK